MIFFPEIYPVFRFFRIFSGFSLNLYISSQNGWYTSHIWYDDFLFRKFIRFPDFFPDFSGFSLNFQISSQNGLYSFKVWYDDFFPDFFWIFIISSDSFFYYSLLRSRSRTLKDLSLVHSYWEVSKAQIFSNMF